MLLVLLDKLLHEMKLDVSLIPYVQEVESKIASNTHLMDDYENNSRAFWGSVRQIRCLLACDAIAEKEMELWLSQKNPLNRNTLSETIDDQMFNAQPMSQRKITPRERNDTLVKDLEKLSNIKQEMEARGNKNDDDIETKLSHDLRSLSSPICPMFSDHYTMFGKKIDKADPVVQSHMKERANLVKEKTKQLDAVMQSKQDRAVILDNFFSSKFLRIFSALDISDNLLLPDYYDLIDKCAGCHPESFAGVFKFFRENGGVNAKRAILGSLYSKFENLKPDMMKIFFAPDAMPDHALLNVMMDNCLGNEVSLNETWRKRTSPNVLNENVAKKLPFLRRIFNKPDKEKVGKIQFLIRGCYIVIQRVLALSSACLRYPARACVIQRVLALSSACLRYPARACVVQRVLALSSACLK
jgi:hypothetical protein